MHTIAGSQTAIRDILGQALYIDIKWKHSNSVRQRMTNGLIEQCTERIKLDVKHATWSNAAIDLGYLGGHVLRDKHSLHNVRRRTHL